ncbi:MmgE/PrpD family protein [Pseudonocardia ailaonensis]|uniref:MmgE/PrpD family protein n=1 Tax=Pseudonocardia ailaonensis TaxID=367279 RepID=A0ABN2N4V1_9PSEU
MSTSPTTTTGLPRSSAANAQGRLQGALASIVEDDRPIGPDVRAGVVRQVRDTLGVALAAVPAPGVQAVLRAVEPERGDSPAWGHGIRLSRPAAALVNGTAVQALEFDDIVHDSTAHLSSVLVPVASTFGAGVPADEAFAGFVAGLRAARTVGPLLGRPAHKRGVQPTHTIGAVAGAVAAARLLGMTAEQCSDVLALAVTGVVGTRAHTGTPAKAMQSGIAAAATVRAVELVRAGVRAGGGVVDTVISTLGERLPDGAFDTGEITFPSIKPYPSCGVVHSAVEAILRLREQTDVTEPELLEVRMPPRARPAMPFENPATGDEARWSAVFVLAQAWRHGRLTLDQYSPQEIATHGSAGPPAWLRIVPDESFDPDGEETVVRAVLGGGVEGRTLEAAIDQRLDYPGRPLAEAQLMDKYLHCVTRGLDVSAALALWTGVDDHPLAVFGRI